MANSVSLPFAGDRRSFRLRIGELRELQDKCNAGPATILARLMSFQPQAADARRPLLQNYEFGIDDPDYQADLNVFAMTRQIGGDWRVEDVRETVRLGLIGGGTNPTDAHAMVFRYVDESDEWTENIAIASAILAHTLLGEQGDPVGKEAAETTKTKATGA